MAISDDCAGGRSNNARAHLGDRYSVYPLCSLLVDDTTMTTHPSFKYVPPVSPYYLLWINGRAVVATNKRIGYVR